MSSLRWPDIGESTILQLVANKLATPRNLVLKLFSNDLAYTEDVVAGDLTEATFTGYSAITLTGANWTPAEADPTTLSHAESTFSSSADQTPELIYGHFYVHETSGTLIAVHKWDSSVTIQSDGDAIRITPVLTAEDSGD